MHEYFKIGDKIYGYCNGFFGRDHYDDMICTFITDKYAVFEYINGGHIGTAEVVNLWYLEICIEQYSMDVSIWKNPSESYEGK